MPRMALNKRKPYSARTRVSARHCLELLAVSTTIMDRLGWITSGKPGTYDVTRLRQYHVGHVLPMRLTVWSELPLKIQGRTGSLYIQR